MRIILKNEVPHLGEAGDIVNVKAGFGRNFLIPQGLAVPASTGSVKLLEHQKRVAESIRRKQLSGAQALAEKISGMAVSIRREAGEDDKLFGSVTNRDIVEALASEGVEVDKRSIHLENSIRAIGLYTVKVNLHREVKAELRVYVTRG